MAGDWRELLFERFEKETAPSDFAAPVDNSAKQETPVHWSHLVKSRLAPASSEDQAKGDSVEGVRLSKAESRQTDVGSVGNSNDEETIEPDYIPPVKLESSDERPFTPDIKDEQSAAALPAEQYGDMSSVEPRTIAGSDEPEDVIPGIMTKAHTEIATNAENKGWKFKRNAASREPGWKPRLLAKRPRIDFGDASEPASDAPPTLETSATIEVKEPVKSAEPRMETEKENLVTLVKKVIFDETGGQIEVDEYRGLAEKFSNAAVDIINRVKGADSHKKNAKQTEEIGHIVWSNPSPLDKLTTSLDGGQTMDPDQEKIAELDESVSAELNMDPNPGLEQIAAPKPVAAEEPSLEFNEVTPAAEAGPGPSFQSPVDTGSPLEAQDEASRLLHQAVGQTDNETAGVPSATETSAADAPEVEESPAFAALAPEPPAEQHFAASIATEPTATVYPNPETPLVSKTPDATVSSERPPLTLVGPEQDAIAPEGVVESPTINLDDTGEQAAAAPDLKMVVNETPQQPAKKKGLLGWLGIGKKNPVAELHGKIGDPSPVDSSVASKAQQEMIKQQKQRAESLKDAA